MKLGFFEIQESADDLVSAALLVTDAATRPLEFRITEPVRVLEVQRVLYGAAFEEQLYCACLLAPMLEAMRAEPDVLLVRDQRLLALHGLAELPPILWIGRGDAAVDGRTGFVVGSRARGSEHDAIRAQLGAAVAGRDLLEPFERIAVALDRIPAETLGARA